MATAALSPSDIASPIRLVLRHQRTSSVLLGEVDGDRPRPAAACIARRRRAALRLPDPRHRRDALVLRPRRVGAARARPQVARRRAGDPPPRPARVRGGRARDAIPARAAALLTFVIVGGGPTGVELAGALAEIARQTLRHDFRRIDPDSGAHHPARGRPASCRPFPEPLRAAPRASLERARRRGAHGTIVTGDRRRWRQCGAASGDDSASPRGPCCGRPASPPRRWRSRSACRSTAPAACSSSPT